MTETDDAELGITEEDRRKMGRWAAASPPDTIPDTTPYDSTDEIVKDVKDELAWLDSVEGLEFVTTSRVSDGLDYSHRKVGRVLSFLETEGFVERDGRTKRSGIRWLLTLGGDQG